MYVSAGRRVLAIAVLSCIAVFAATPVTLAQQEREIAARALLGEAEKLIECALPQEAISVLDRVKAELPGTEAAAYSDLRKAQCYLFLARYDDAITLSSSLVTNNSGTMLGCWAQSCLGQALVKKGEVTAGIAELEKVRNMLPDRRDLGPLNEAREVLGRVCLDYLVGRTDDLDAVEYLGWNRADSSAKARVLATLAAYRARQGQLLAAKSTLARLESECPAETNEVTWAKTEVALYAKRLAANDPESTATLAEILQASTGEDHLGATAALALARDYSKTGRTQEAVDALRVAKDKYCGTAASPEAPEILYDLGNSLCRQGKTKEGVAELKQVADSAPRSGYAAPALYCIGSYAASGSSDAKDALTTLADGSYDRRWRGLAYWRLGTLYRSSDRVRARDCYASAVKIFQKCLDEQKADVGDWRGMLQARIAIIQSEMQTLGATE